MAERAERVLPWVTAGWVAGAGAWGIATRGGLSIDEAWSVSIAHRPLTGVLEVIAARERNMALFFLLLHGWAAVSTDTRWLLVLPLVLAVGAVAALAWVARLLAGDRAAAVATCLLAANTTYLSYAVELRGYSLDVGLATVTVGCFVQLLRAGGSTDDRARRRRWATAFVLAALAFTATTVLAALLLLALGLVALARPARRRHVLVPLAVLALVLAPVEVVVLATDQGNVDWIPPLTVHQVASAALVLTGGRVGLALAGVTVVTFAVALARARPPARTQAWVVAAWIAVPLLGLVAFSLVKPLMVPRYVLFVLPGLAVAAGVVAAPLRRGLIVGVTAATLVAAGGMSLPWTQRESDVDAAAAAVVSHARPGDAVVYDPAEARAWFGDSLGGWASRQPRPRDLALAPGGSPWDLGDTYGRDVLPRVLVARAAGVERLWVIDYSTWGLAGLVPETFRSARDDVLAGRHEAGRWRFGEARVTLWVRDAPSRTPAG